MRYFKNGSRIGQFTDIQTGVTIKRNHIIALEQPTKAMKPFLLKKGILEVSEAEYQSWISEQSKKFVSNPQELSEAKSSVPVDELAEQKKVLESEKKESDEAQNGSLVTAKPIFKSKAKKAEAQKGE